MINFSAHGLFVAYAACMSIYLILDYAAGFRTEQVDADEQVAP